MEGTEQLLSGSPEFQRIKHAVEKHATPVLVTGLSGVHKAHMIVSVTSQLDKRGLVLVHDEANAMRICEDINIMAGDGTAVLFPSREATCLEV